MKRIDNSYRPLDGKVIMHDEQGVLRLVDWREGLDPDEIFDAREFPDEIRISRMGKTVIIAVDHPLSLPGQIARCEAERWRLQGCDVTLMVDNPEKK